MAGTIKKHAENWLNRSLAPFPGLQHGVRLRRLQASKRRASAIYDQHYKTAIAAGKSHDELEHIVAEMFSEVGFIEEEIAALQTRRLIERADRYDVPRPSLPYSREDDETWFGGHYTGLYHLKPEPYAELRSRVRKEQKERLELWTPLASLAVAMMSMIVALAALLK